MRWDAACADVASRAGANVDGHHSSCNYDGLDSESHDDDNSEVLAEDKEYMKANANRVPKGPSDCNRGMYVWLSTVGLKQNERRSQGRPSPKLCKRPQGSGSVDRAHVPGPQGFLRCVGETHMKCQLVHKAEPLPMCAS